MLAVILLYDQLLFRPLVAWADRFRFEQQAGAFPPRPGSRRDAPLARARAIDRPAVQAVAALLSVVVSRLVAPTQRPNCPAPARPLGRPPVDRLCRCLDGSGFVARGVFVFSGISLAEAVVALCRRSRHAGRVIILIAIATVIWVPIGVMVGMRPQFARFVQPIAQFLAAFPANVLFPVAVSAIVAFNSIPISGSVR